MSAKHLGGAAVLAVPLFLSACARPYEILRDPPPGKAQVAAVLPEGGFADCGPEVLAAILALNGDPVPVKDISAEICEPGRGGTIPIRMAAYAAGRGLRALCAPCSRMEHLRAALDLGIPPVVMVRLAPLVFHYFLVVGARDGEVVFAHYGRQLTVMREPDFLRVWERTGRFTLFIGKDLTGIPWTRDDFFKSLDEPPIPFEPIDADWHAEFGLWYEKQGYVRLARIQYERALRKNPAQTRAALALGNLLYAEKKYGEAAEAFRHGAHAGGACANNLAWVLSEHFGRNDLAGLWALRAKHQSVRLSEPWFQACDTRATVAMRERDWALAESEWREAAEAAEDLGGPRRAAAAAGWAGAARAAVARGDRLAALEWLNRSVACGLDAKTAEEIRAAVADLK